MKKCTFPLISAPGGKYCFCITFSIGDLVVFRKGSVRNLKSENFMIFCENRFDENIDFSEKVDFLAENQIS